MIKTLFKWIFKDQIGGVIVALNGHKSFLGGIVFALGLYLVFQHGTIVDGPTFLVAMYEPLLKAFGEQPLSDGEMVQLVGQVKLTIGLLHKAWKKIRGLPQDPKKSEKVAPV
jgi:hypothetical protein